VARRRSQARRSQAIPRLAKQWSAAILFLMFATLVPQPGVRAAEEAPPLEYQVKAAFLLNFTKFIDWPPAESAGGEASFDICILGDDPFGPTLDQMLDGETLQGRRLAVQRVSRRPLPGSCRVVFIGKSEKDISGVLSAAAPGVLTVGESAGFLREGGMIGFVIENRRVRFDINEAAATRAGFKVSSKLLNVARSVEKTR
jgi:hypothetical protein